jgi:L-threonylcarbamoyladenylate synthase
MKTLKIDLDHPNVDYLDQAAEALNQGQIIIYPSGTAYSLAANALKPKLITQLFQLKSRPLTDPLHIIVRDWDMATTYIQPTDVAKFLWERFTPAPLTLVLRKKPLVPNILTSGLPTLGIRFPNYSVAYFLSAALDFPYTSTSANPSGKITPYSLSQVKSQFTPAQLSQISLAVDIGRIARVPPSTVLDLTTTPPTLLREGPVSREELESILGKLA